ncbi:MAG: patatin-like phospholipase family protein [Bacteroidota bacterium]
MKRALVLSGGGANGAFQFGALKYIEEEVKPRIPDFHYNLIAGVSVGAINGTMIAMDNFWRLDKIWNSPNLEKLIYHGKLEVLNVMMRLMSQQTSVLDNSPLLQLFRRYIHLDEIDPQRYDLRIGAVSLRSGSMVSFRPTDFDDEEMFRKALLASTSIPIFWAPVPEVKTKTKTYYDLVDGGIRDTTPLGEIIGSQPDEVIIINCKSPKFSIEPKDHPYNSIFSIAYRSLVDIAMDEIFINDLREFLSINELVRQAKAQSPDIKLYHTSKSTGKKVELRQYQTILIEPNVMMGDIIDFSAKTIRSRIDMGYKAAKRAFAAYEGKLDGSFHSSNT